MLPPIPDQTLLAQALTHRSYTNEHPEMKHNERLEFLGDAILGFTVGELLYKHYPDLSEAELTRLRSKLVDATQLAKLAIQLELGKEMKLGKGAVKDGARDNPALLSDTFEAIIGAYYLASGIEAVQQYVKDLFKPILKQLTVSQNDSLPTQLVDVKNRLQQWSLAHVGVIPEYRLVEETGPDHAKEFTFEVRIQGQFYGQGKGRKKQEATKAAAQMALSIIETRSSFSS
ncbi:MAG: ribonuclease III [Microcystaceae cyanobacterium]